MDLEKEAAIAIRHALMNEGSLIGIAKELGKLAVLYPVKSLPINMPLFDSCVGLEMENAYKEGIIHIERMDLTTP